MVCCGKYIKHVAKNTSEGETGSKNSKKSPLKGALRDLELDPIVFQ
jgi:hypothetical protein